MTLIERNQTVNDWIIRLAQSKRSQPGCNPFRLAKKLNRIILHHYPACKIEPGTGIPSKLLCQLDDKNRMTRAVWIGREEAAGITFFNAGGFYE